MSRSKFFTLIHGGSVHLASDTPILPAEQYSTLMDGYEILQQIKDDTEKYRREVIDECEMIKEQARQEGYEEGFRKWAEHSAKLEQEIKDLRKEFEKTTLLISLAAAKKIVGREMEQSEKTVIDIISNSLKAVTAHKRIILYVSKNDYEVLEKYKNDLKLIFENLESFSIQEKDNIDPGGCVIETEGGIINARLENKWQVLEQVFQQRGQNSRL